MVWESARKCNFCTSVEKPSLNHNVQDDATRKSVDGGANGAKRGNLQALEITH